MKVVIQVDNLVKALGDVHGIVEKKAINPILLNVMLKAETNKLILNTTDMELDITKIIEANTEVEGETTVPAQLLYDTVKKLNPKDNITLELNETTLHVECNGFKGKFPCLPVENFPITKEDNFNNTFSLNVKSLKFLISKTKLAISLDESRYYLNGIYLHQTEENGTSLLRAVATDGHRLALADAPLPEGANNINGIIIPKKTVDELYKILDKVNEDENVEISLSDVRVSFKFSNLILNSKLIDGSFPDYKKVIPTNNNLSIEVSTEKLLHAVDLVSTFSDDKIRAVKLLISGNNLTISANKENNYSSGSQFIDINNNSNEEMTVSFNAKYLIDILDLIEHVSTNISLSSPTAPTLIKNKEGGNDLFVIMPMRI